MGQQSISGEPEPAKMGVQNTKNELLSAYAELRKQYIEQLKTLGKNKEAKQKEHEDVIITRASEQNNDTISESIRNLIGDVHHFVEKIEKQALSERNKLSEIQKAIAYESANLEEIHAIKVAADSLETLQKTHEEKKAQFELEKNAWVQKKQREEEEYAYLIKKERERETAEYAERKIELEKTWKERERVIAEKEIEYTQLKERVASFPEMLSKAEKETEVCVTQELENKFLLQKTLEQKDFESEKALLTVRVETLQQTIIEQKEELVALANQLVDANKRMQEIAVRTIEGNSGAQTLAAVNRIALEQASPYKGREGKAQ